MGLPEYIYVGLWDAKCQHLLQIKVIKAFCG
jgi:hypothetical protein